MTEIHKYPCIALQHPELETWCGYVIIPQTHPMVGKHYDDKGFARIKVHGGLTFAGGSVPLTEERAQGWVVGFDCAHLGDYIPQVGELLGYGNNRNEHEWTEEETLSECQRLAVQLFEMTLIEDSRVSEAQERSTEE